MGITALVRRADEAAARLDRKALKLDRPLAEEKYLKAVRRWWLMPVIYTGTMALTFGVCALIWGPNLPPLGAFVLPAVALGVNSGYLLAENERLNGGRRPSFAQRRPRSLDPR